MQIRKFQKRDIDKMNGCEACEGNGWLVFSDETLQRCDACERYEGDLEAAVAFFKSGGLDPMGRKYWLHEVKLKLALPEEL